jgi:choline dehydrogenase
VIAAKLSEDPNRDVMVLEAGHDFPAGERPVEIDHLFRPVRWPLDWDDKVETIRDRLLVYRRGRVVGGSSATNGAVAMRPEPPDLNSWPKGWQWDELLPYFRALERDIDFPDAPWHGDDGPVPIVRYPEQTWNDVLVRFVDACVELGHPWYADQNEPGTTGIGPVPMNRIDDMRISNTVAYLDGARHRSNLSVRGDAHVRRLIVQRGRVVGVELADGSGIQADDTILCAGVVQNPLLLWRSGIGPAEEVSQLGVEVVADVPAVGSNLTDHPVMTLTTPLAPGTLSDAPHLQMILRTTAPGSDQLHDLQITPTTGRDPDGTELLVLSIALQLPVGRGRVVPSGPDVGDRARIQWPFARYQENLRRLAEGWRFGCALAARSGLSADPEGLAASAAQDDAALEEFVAAEHTAFFHGVGTCAMGEDDDSVVGTDLRVRAVDGLAVVDASVIPRVPRSNTHIAVTAIALRAAELLA